MEITVASIRRHNFVQVVSALFGILGALVVTAAIYFFFWGTWSLVVWFSGIEGELQKWARPFGGAMVAIVWILGLLRYRSGLGGIDYWDSIDTVIPRGETAGVAVVDYYASQVTAPAAVISNAFVAAPRWLLDGLKRFRRLIPAREEWATRMETLRRRLDEERGWKPLVEFSEMVDELQFLHWMKIAAIGLRKEIPSVRISLEAQTRRDEHST